MLAEEKTKVTSFIRVQSTHGQPTSSVSVDGPTDGSINISRKSKNVFKAN